MCRVKPEGRALLQQGMRQTPKHGPDSRKAHPQGVWPPKALHIIKSIVHFFIKKSLLLPGGYLPSFIWKMTKSVSNNEILASRCELWKISHPHPLLLALLQDLSWVGPWRILGLLYTRSQGWCSTQIKHSYWCKSWNWPQGPMFFNLPQASDKCWTLWPCHGPKAEKKDTNEFATLGSNIPSFINILTSMF
jgi:hypothetical protein